MASRFPEAVPALRSQPQPVPKPSLTVLNLDFDRGRDAYGFNVRPQHIQTYREYANIYREEEEERLKKWNNFLKQVKQPSDPTQTDGGERDPSTEQKPRGSEVKENSVPSRERNDPVEQKHNDPVVTEKGTEPVQSVNTEVNDTREESFPSGVRDDSAEQKSEDSEVAEKEINSGRSVSTEVNDIQEKSVPSGQRDDSTKLKPGDSALTEEETKPVHRVSTEVNDTQEGSVFSKAAPTTQQVKPRVVKAWVKISPYLHCIEQRMSARVKKQKNMKGANTRDMHHDLSSTKKDRFLGGPKDDKKDVFNDNDTIENCAPASAEESTDGVKLSPEQSFPWKELECLVQGGVPKDLRGEVWQAFVGVKARRVERYYQDLLSIGSDNILDNEQNKGASEDYLQQNEVKKYDLPEKLKRQIEKDLPRTFPGHPALNDNGRDSLRRVLWAYARHNPSVGYCQAMNFFAGLLLLMMPEENAFWTLVGIIDDYFEGYFSQEMIESQVDQLVFEELMREKFPKLVNHLEFLGMEVAWICGPWFLSIFVNTLPWESVLRVWDVLLFEGNRVMLFRTALALMDFYGPALGTTKDAGDAIILLQTLTGSTFDSSQLVMTACMGFLTITEDRLEELRDKHRPSVLATMEERAKGSRVFKDPKAKGLATKLYSFKHDPGSIVKESKTERQSIDTFNIDERSDQSSHSANVDEFLQAMSLDTEVDSLPDLQEQVVWLKVELCRLLEEKRSAVLRAEELEAAFMEMVQKDNRRELSARVEQLELEVGDLQQALADKKAAEQAMLEVLLKVEKEQRVTEDARRCAEEEAATQRQVAELTEEKYQKAMIALIDMEKRAVLAESMLEATIQYESGQTKAAASPRLGNPGSPHDAQMKKGAGLLSFGLGWRDRNKGKSSQDLAPGDSKSQNDGSDKGNGDADSGDPQK